MVQGAEHGLCELCLPGAIVRPVCKVGDTLRSALGSFQCSTVQSPRSMSPPWHDKLIVLSSAVAGFGHKMSAQWFHPGHHSSVNGLSMQGPAMAKLLLRVQFLGLF